IACSPCSDCRSQCHLLHRLLHSFPTRRSSDLPRTPSVHGWDRIAARARGSGVDAVTSEVVLSWFTPDMYEERPEAAARFIEDFGGIDPEGFASVYEAVAQMDQRHLVSVLRLPTLVVSAAPDPLLPPGHG